MAPFYLGEKKNIRTQLAGEGWMWPTWQQDVGPRRSASALFRKRI